MQPPQVTDLINKLIETPNDSVAQVLGEIDVWKWARSDLNAWIKVLNKFDAILEDVIRDYDVDKLQIKPFSPSAKNSVSEILRFERLLLENSTNRKMYNSYDVSPLFPFYLGICLLKYRETLEDQQSFIHRGPRCTHTGTEAVAPPITAVFCPAICLAGSQHIDATLTGSRQTLATSQRIWCRPCRFGKGLRYLRGGRPSSGSS